jgi:hypothetical protein
MLKRHAQKSRECDGRRVLPEDEIWQNAQDVWTELPNSKLASAYVQAYRIADKVRSVSATLLPASIFRYVQRTLKTLNPRIDLLDLIDDSAPPIAPLLIYKKGLYFSLV